MLATKIKREGLSKVFILFFERGGSGKNFLFITVVGAVFTEPREAVLSSRIEGTQATSLGCVHLIIWARV